MNDDGPCICGRLRRASRTLSRLYDAALAPVGLTVTQFSILRNLAQLDLPTLNQIADRTAHEKSAMWRTLQPMIRQGWVAVEPGRAQRFTLTGAGRERLDLAHPIWIETQTRVSHTLGEREDALIDLLHEIETHA